MQSGIRIQWIVVSVALFVSISAGAQQKAAPAQGAPTSAAPSPSQEVNPLPGPSLPPQFDPKTGQSLYKTVVEDWSSLEIGTSQLHPENPLLGEVDEHETFTRTLLQLKWRPGDAMDLYVIMPKNVKNPPVVLYLYGFPSDTGRFKDNGWCERVTAGGVAAVGMVSALTGHRFHDRPMKEWFVSELQESLGETVHDVKFILDYMASRGDLDMDRVGMFGEGSGGAIAIMAASVDPRIKALDLLDPWGDWPDWIAKTYVIDDEQERAQYLKPEFLAKVAPLEPTKWLKTLKTSHVRLQQTMDDQDSPPEVKAKYKEAAPAQVEVVNFQENTELFGSESGGKLFDWVKKQVKDMPAPKTAVAQDERPGASTTKQ